MVTVLLFTKFVIMLFLKIKCDSSCDNSFTITFFNGIYLFANYIPPINRRYYEDNDTDLYIVLEDHIVRYSELRQVIVIGF